MTFSLHQKPTILVVMYYLRTKTVAKTISVSIPTLDTVQTHFISLHCGNRGHSQPTQHWNSTSTQTWGELHPEHSQTSEEQPKQGRTQSSEEPTRRQEHRHPTSWQRECDGCPRPGGLCGQDGESPEGQCLQGSEAELYKQSWSKSIHCP